MPSIADKHEDPPSALDYGARSKSDVRGFCVHMAESTVLEVWRYLKGNPKRGVSVQYTVEKDGTIVSMVPELHISGSINPRTVRTTNDPDHYYGVADNKAALKGLWDNPNRGVIAVEVAGKAVDGPNAVQVDALVRLFKDCRTRYPGIVPLGHRDFQDVKRCPGKTAAIKRMFRLMGGHGTDYDPHAADPPPDPQPDELDQLKAENADLKAQVEDLTTAIKAADAILDEQLGETD